MIALTTKYALTTLMEASRSDECQFIRIKDLSKKVKVPTPYLAKLVRLLTSAGFLEGKKGPGGGIRVTKLGRTATLFDVCRVVREPLIEDSCFLSKKACHEKHHCPVHSRWSIVRGATLAFFKQTRICDYL